MGVCPSGAQVKEGIGGLEQDGNRWRRRRVEPIRSYSSEVFSNTILVSFYARLIPVDFYPVIFSSWSKWIIWHWWAEGKLGKREEREQSIVVRGNKRVSKVAFDVGDDFCYLRRVEKNIKLGVGRAIANKVVIGRVVDICVDQIPVITKIFQEAASVFIFGVYVGISSDKQQSIWILLAQVYNAVFQLDHFINKLSISTGSWEVNGEMN